MAVTVTHPFVSAIADDPTAAGNGEVLPSHWNAAHTVAGVEFVYNVQDYGALCDGSTDDSTAVIAAIAACQSASGGVVYFPGMTRCDSQLLIPNDGAGPVPHQKAMIFRGCGSHFKGIASPISGGSGLDLRYAGTVGKIVTLGLGSLTIEDMTITNGHNDSLPFIHTTNTTLLVRNNGFVGYDTGGTFSDAIVLGGQGAAAGPLAGDYFQGYGTVVECNYFSYINRGVLLQKHANAVVIRDNAWWTTCEGSAAIEDWNSSSNGIQGLYTSGNLIEMNNYTYGICMNYAARGVHLGDTFYDGSGTFTSYYRFGAATPNCVIPGFYDVATIAKLGSGSFCPVFPITSAANELSFVDSTGSFTNSDIKTGRLEVIGNRIVIRDSNNDETFHIYSSSHEASLLATQSDGYINIRDYLGSIVLQFDANAGTFSLRNQKASTGYTYWQVRGGAGQSTIPLGRYKDLNDVNGTTINPDGSFKFHLNTEFGNNETNGQSIGIKSLTELLTIAAAATSTTTIQKPAHSIILGVSVRVTTAVTCTTDFTVGDSTNAARFSTAAVSKAVNSTDKGTKAGAYYNATAEGIVITPDTVPSDATGRVRVTIHYLEVTAPTS